MGATPLDFAYSVHTQLGNQCAGAKVNGQIVKLNYRAEKRRCHRDPPVSETAPEQGLAEDSQDIEGKKQDPDMVEDPGA